MYPELMVIPMREELSKAGVAEARTAEMCIRDRSQVAMQQAGHVTQILRVQRSVQAQRVAQRGDVRGGRAVAQHLHDGVAGNKVNQQKRCV